SQFKFAALENIRGIAAHVAFGEELAAFFLQFVADCGATPYNYLRQSGFTQDSDSGFPQLSESENDTTDNEDVAIRFQKSSAEAKDR
ncbi:UNVERIFIED_CONTAM: hypothetical protein HDU68_006213, partial [Siphonaria sp. JEL0065]